MLYAFSIIQDTASWRGFVHGDLPSPTARKQRTSPRQARQTDAEYTELLSCNQTLSLPHYSSLPPGYIIHHTSTRPHPAIDLCQPRVGIPWSCLCYRSIHAPPIIQLKHRCWSLMPEGAPGPGPGRRSGSLRACLVAGAGRWEDM